MICQFCGAALTLPFIWEERSRSMEEGPYHCAVPHLCPPPDSPSPNERWCRGQVQKPKKPEQGVAAKVTRTVPAPPTQRQGYRADADL